jgi:hypothetical protein
VDDHEKETAMNRRVMLKTTGMALAAIGMGACGPKRVASAPALPLPGSKEASDETINLAMPRIAWERVIRTTIGLRPHRDSGFVLKPEKFDAKTVIHDYGFGGAGMSLAWGCGAMAADMCLPLEDRRVAVLGCGSPGLTAARQLQRRGFDVTIYTLAVPPYTTSNMSFAGFTPTAGLIEPNRRTPAWDAQFRQAAEISYRELQLLSGMPGYGVYWIDSYNGADALNVRATTMTSVSCPKPCKQDAIARCSVRASTRFPPNTRSGRRNWRSSRRSTWKP